jgi:hypothetical protein
MIDTRAEFFITNDKETSLIFRIPNKIIRIYEQFLYERKDAEIGGFVPLSGIRSLTNKHRKRIYESRLTLAVKQDLENPQFDNMHQLIHNYLITSKSQEQPTYLGAATLNGLEFNVWVNDLKEEQGSIRMHTGYRALTEAERFLDQLETFRAQQHIDPGYQPPSVQRNMGMLERMLPPPSVAVYEHVSGTRYLLDLSFESVL